MTGDNARSAIRLIVVPVSLVVALVAPASAATRTVTLSVPGMTCATCPVTVRTALRRVDGVLGTVVSWQSKEAVVSFDDARTDVRTLLDATRNAGYPAIVRAQP